MSEIYLLQRFGIDEIYIHKGLEPHLLEKLYQRAELSLMGEDSIVKRHALHDFVLVFYKKIPSPNLIYRFLEYLNQYPDKENFIHSNTLLNTEELFAVLKIKKFALVTPRKLDL